MDPNSQQNPSNQYHQNPNQDGAAFNSGQDVQAAPGQIPTGEQVYSIPTQGTNTENVRPGQDQLQQQQQQQAAAQRPAGPRPQRAGVQSIWTLIAIIFLTAILFFAIGGAVFFVNQQGKINILENDKNFLTQENEQLAEQVRTGGEPDIVVGISELGVDYIYNRAFEDVQYALDGTRIELGSRLLMEQTRKSGGNDSEVAACSAGFAGTGFIYRINEVDVLPNDSADQDPALVDTFAEITEGQSNGTVRDLGDFYVVLIQPNTFCSKTIDAQEYSTRYAETINQQRDAFFKALRATQTNS